MKILVGQADSRVSDQDGQLAPSTRRLAKKSAVGHRGIASLALALMISFLLLASLDSQLVFIHLYESLIYLAIVVMLFFVKDRWTYTLGMLAPAIWLMLMLIPGACAVFFFYFGGVPEILRPLQLVFRLPRTSVWASLLGIGILILSVWMSLFCGNRWASEFAGFRNRRSIFLACLGVIGIYYGAMVLWVLRQLVIVA